jgi:hypothetical protein
MTESVGGLYQFTGNTKARSTRSPKSIFNVPPAARTCAFPQLARPVADEHVARLNQSSGHNAAMNVLEKISG